MRLQPIYASIVLARAYSAIAASVATDGPIIDLGYAKYIGNNSLPDVDFFGGIPYAQPPLGDLRFRAPVMMNESVTAANITDAQGFGSPCIQQPAALDFGSEDCLTLNVWKPSSAQEGDSLPVALYIHGGGDYYGSAIAFPMNTWVSDSNLSIVAVSIQYRLGLLGFLASSEVFQDGDVNAGLLDQRAAIAWVKRHISKFGGDPGRITISGESSGGASVVYHILAYSGQQEPDFQGAIAQSIGTDPIPLPETYEECFSNVTSLTNCSSPTTQSTMSCLRSAPLSAIVNAVNSKPSSCKFLPVIDGALIPDLPTTLISQGRFANVSLIAGHCTDDGSIFVGSPAKFTNTTQGFVNAITKRYTNLSNNTISRMIELYPESDFDSQWDRAVAAFGDTVFTCQDWFLANALRQKGQPNVYNYRFNTPDPVQLAANPWEGVMHTSDLFYLFQGTNSGPSPNTSPTRVLTPFTPPEAALSLLATSYWTSFARDHSPSTFRAVQVDAPTWPTIEEGRLVLQTGTESRTDSVLEQRTKIYEERCQFWNGAGHETRV